MKKGLFELVPFDWVKGAIVAVFVAILTYIQQLLTEGGHISIKMIATTTITSLIGYMIKQLMTDSDGAVLSYIGGRKKRKKKPTSFTYDSFEFDGNDFEMSSVVYYTSDSATSELTGVSSVFNSPNSQTVIFTSPIQFTDFESLFFEVEVD